MHVQRNSAAVITATTIQIDRTVAALTVFLQLMTALVVAVYLLVSAVNWVVALSAALLFLTTYSILATTVRKELHVNSQRISVAVKQQIQALQEGLSSIRDVLLDGNQKTYVEIDWRIGLSGNCRPRINISFSSLAMRWKLWV